jgi:hypothetical protein
MATKAKFMCQSVAKRVGWAQVPFVYEAEFFAVGGDAPENKEFFAATPSGSIKLSTVRSDHFKPGKEYYVTFEEGL